MTIAQDKIRLSKSFVGEREARAAADAIVDGRLGMGTHVESFERDLSLFIGGSREVVCVNTGTAALHLALEACGIGPGDEVLVPTLTYVASFQAISATGAAPIPCDVRRETGNLDVKDAARRVTERTRAIMPVHYASAPGDLNGVYRLAAHHGLRVVEDAAHAFGCLWQGRRVGATGDIVCFSFDGIKNITSGEGGAIVTADRKIAERVRDSRLLGVEKDTEKRFMGERSWEFDVARQGWRYHMSNVFAAIGRVQLSRFEGELGPKRIALARRYVQMLGGLRGIARLQVNYREIVPHIFPVLVGEGKRDSVRQALLRAGVECGIHYKPNHLLSYYGGGRVSLPQAEALYSELLTLPLHPELTSDDQDLIVGVVKSSLRN